MKEISYGAELLSGKTGDWRLGKFRSGVSRLPFLCLPVRRKCIKNIIG